MVGPSLAQPWHRAEDPRALDAFASGTLRIDGGPAYAPWVPEEVVDPVGFRNLTIERRLRRYGVAA